MNARSDTQIEAAEKARLEAEAAEDARLDNEGWDYLDELDRANAYRDDDPTA